MTVKLSVLKVPVFAAWRQIETAPRGPLNAAGCGPTVLLFVDDGVGLGYWDSNLDKFYAEHPEAHGGEPTHWMPLPDPPVGTMTVAELRKASEMKWGDECQPEAYVPLKDTRLSAGILDGRSSAERFRAMVNEYRIEHGETDSLAALLFPSPPDEGSK